MAAVAGENSSLTFRYPCWHAAGIGGDHSDALEVLPDIPNVGEFVPGYEASGWQGIGIPRNTPVEIIDKLNKAINAGLGDPVMRRRFAESAARCLRARPPTSASSSRRNREVGQGDPGSPHQGRVR
jgi:hypothetical protein